MTLIEKTESAYKKLKWHEKLCTWNIQNKRFLRTINSFRENLRAKGVEEKDFKPLEEYFELLRDCDACFSKRQPLLLTLLACSLTSIDYQWIFNFLNKGNSCVSPVIILMLNIMLVYTISFVLREMKESLRIKNIHYFFLYEDLNARLTEKEKK